MYRRIIPFIVAALIVACLPTRGILPPGAANSPLAAPLAEIMYVPLIIDSPPTRTPVPTRVLQPAATPMPCYRTSDTALFASMLMTDARQQRVRLFCHPALVEAAYRRGISMAQLGYFGHCEPGGPCANVIARESGCRLPPEYGSGNEVESIAAGSPTWSAIYDALARSPSHSEHLFGKNDFFRQQYHIGVAHISDPHSKWKDYWVIMIGVCR